MPLRAPDIKVGCALQRGLGQIPILARHTIERIGLLIIVCMAWQAGQSLPAVQTSTMPFVAFAESSIQSSQGSAGINVGHIDGDGYIDVAAGGGDLGSNVYWYRYPLWDKFLIGTEGGGDDLQIADINRDGALDVIVNGGDQIIWYENPRGRGASVQDVWKKHIVDSGAGSYDLVVRDLDGDGRVDIVSRQDFGFTYYYLQGPSDTWTRVLVPQATPGHGGLAVGDINRDGRPDLVENGFWLQAPADRLNGVWIKHDIVGWDSGSSVGLADINHDGRLDVFLSVSGSSVGSLAWFEAPVDPINGNWIRHDIDTIQNVRRFHLIDINKDGAEDLAFAETPQSSSKRVGVYYNRGLGMSWMLGVLSTEGSHNTAVGDLDRPRLASIVFSDPAERRALDAIVHPAVRRLASERFSELAVQGELLACYEIPLLYEVGLEQTYAPTVVVNAPEALRRARLAARDGLDPRQRQVP